MGLLDTYVIRSIFNNFQVLIGGAWGEFSLESFPAVSIVITNSPQIAPNMRRNDLIIAIA